MRLPAIRPAANCGMPSGLESSPAKKQMQHTINESDCPAVQARLKASGFVVSCKCISDAPGNTLWQAKAICGGREWIALGRNMAAALRALEEQSVKPALTGAR